MTDDLRDGPTSPGVIVPPPLLFAGALVAGLLAGRGAPSESFGARVGRIVGPASAVAGGLCCAAAFRTIRGAKTTLRPDRSATVLCTSGVFALTRNPIYVGFTSIYVGIAMALRSQPAFVLLPIVLALLDRHVVDREERSLERIFGDAYLAYRTRVPRWF